MKEIGDLIVLGALGVLAAVLTVASAVRILRDRKEQRNALSALGGLGTTLLVLLASSAVAWRIAEAHAVSGGWERDPLGVWLVPAQVVLGGLVVGLLAGWVVDDLLVTRRTLRSRLREQARRIEQTESSFESVVEGLPIGVFVVEPAEGRILEASLAGAGLLGWPRAELLGRPFGEFLASPHRSLEDTLRAAREPEVPADRFCRLRRRDGSTVESEISVTPIVFRGAPALVVTAHDVSSLELARRAAEAASEAKNRFLVQLGHEVRTPLNAILGAISLARADPEDPRHLAGALETIDRAAQSLLIEVEQALDLSRMTLGDPTVDASPFDLRRVVNEVLSQLAPRARARGRRLVDCLQADLPAAWIGDAQRLEALLLALLGRAILLGPSDDVVLTVRPGRDPASGKTLLEFVIPGLPISAGGEGTVDRTSGERGRFGDGGSSLGLMVARELVSTIGGSWTVAPAGREDAPELLIRLPFRPAEQEAPRCGDPALVGRGVLVVHSSDAVRAGLCESLLALGVRAASVPDLAAARSRARRATRERAPIDALLVEVDALEREPAELDALRDQFHRPPPVLGVGTVPRSRWPRPARYGVAVPVSLQELERALVRTFETVPDDEESSGPGMPRGTVLVVEDSAINRRLVADMLERTGLETLTAADGLEALEILEQRPVDLVLMDIEMPRLDGVETTRRLRRSERFASLPILALTARVGSDERHACFAAGFDGFLAKPIDHDVLVTTVFTWLRGDAESLRRDRESIPV